MSGVAVGYCRIPSSSGTAGIKRFRRHASSIATASAAKRNETPSMVPSKNTSKKRLITISTSEGKWHGKWSSDYTFSMKKLQLLDLLDNVQNDTDVFITLFIEKHAGLGMSVEGRISTSFTTKCCNCCSPYLREINPSFKVWVLPSSRPARDSTNNQLPDIGGDDPWVIYVKPGYDADLDSLIQDTIRLATSVNETCSESCEKAEPKLQYLGTRNTASIEKRWHKLLELQRKHDFAADTSGNTS